MQPWRALRLTQQIERCTLWWEDSVGFLPRGPTPRQELTVLETSRFSNGVIARRGTWQLSPCKVQEPTLTSQPCVPLQH
jgi:hypothetical protein